MSAALAVLEDPAASVVERVRGKSSSAVCVYGPSGAGKATVLRIAGDEIANYQPVVSVRASDDSLAAAELLRTMTGALADLGFRGTPRDALADDWSRLVSQARSSLQAGHKEGLVVTVADHDRLEALRRTGGAPGRHAHDVLELIDHEVDRLVITRALPRRGDTHAMSLASSDLTDWLHEPSEWGSLAPAASFVAELGQPWTCLPALSLRLAVALASISELPSEPSPDPFSFAQVLARALGASRPNRSHWVAWQILAAVRSPWEPAGIDLLLQDVAVDSADDLMRHALLFPQADVLHMHPIVRHVGQNGAAAGVTRLLAASMRVQAGHRGVDYFGQIAEAGTEAGAGRRSALAEAQRADCAAMAEEVELAQGTDAQLPDPFDLVGQRTRAEAQGTSRQAFSRAYAADSDDATALRGLAGLSDQAGTDAVSTENLYRRVIEMEPADFASRAKLIGVLLATAQPEAAEIAFESASEIATQRPVPPEALNELLLPVAREAIAYGNLPLAIRCVRLAAEVVDSPLAAHLRDLAEGMVEAVEYGEYVAVHRMGTPWWERPSSLADTHQGQPRTRWLAARVDAVEAGVAHIQYAEVSTTDAAPADRSWLDLSLEELAGLSEDHLPEPLIGGILEIGLYQAADGTDDADEAVVIRVPGNADPAFPVSLLPVDRYTRTR
jgi:hypothetical protein